MINKLILEYSNNIYNKIKDDLVKENIEAIKTTNGNFKSSPRAYKNGSSVYILCSNKNEVLYVGETGVSIKSRCFGDGSASHCEKNWFSKVS